MQFVPSHTVADATGGHGLTQSIKGLWRTYWEHRARRASVMLLSSLDNRTLDDIGLDRSEIESFVYDKSREPAAALRAGLGMSGRARRHGRHEQRQGSIASLPFLLCGAVCEIGPTYDFVELD